MKLYYSAGACSLAVHIALREVGAQFDLTAVDLAKHLTADGTDFYTISPRGYVPLLDRATPKPQRCCNTWPTSTRRRHSSASPAVRIASP